MADLRHKSKEELHEILVRQEKILFNGRFLQSLPDKGKRISEFAEKVRLAIVYREEEERKQALLLSSRAELQSKYQRAFCAQQHGGHAEPGGSHPPGSDPESDASPGSSDTPGNQMETSLDSDQAKERDLVEALGRIHLSNASSAGSAPESQHAPNGAVTEHLCLGRQPPTKLHSLEVLEKSEKFPAARKQQFRLNQLVPRADGSPSGSLPPDPSPGRSSPVSAQARRERDRKHLDDITAARLPPLHHKPAQLLTLEESAALLSQQTKKHQELQAKLAAQKLSEGLAVSMGSFSSEGDPAADYREVQDDEAQTSSGEDD